MCQNTASKKNLRLRLLAGAASTRKGMCSAVACTGVCSLDSAGKMAIPLTLHWSTQTRGDWSALEPRFQEVLPGGEHSEDAPWVGPHVSPHHKGQWRQGGAVLHPGKTIPALEWMLGVWQRGLMWAHQEGEQKLRAPAPPPGSPNPQKRLDGGGGHCLQSGTRDGQGFSEASCEAIQFACFESLLILWTRRIHLTLGDNFLSFYNFTNIWKFLLAPVGVMCTWRLWLMADWVSS